MRIVKVLGLIFIMLPVMVRAQSKILDCEVSSSQGNVTIIADPVLQKSVEPLKYTDFIPESEEEAPTMRGYRIQLYAGSDRNQAQKLTNELLIAYPDDTVYMLYEVPYFKVRFGNYRDRLEAQFMLHELDLFYDEVLLVPDKIHFPKLRD